jgi:hypothetical protein
LDDPRIIRVALDYYDQTGACGHDRFFLILPPPSQIQFWDPFRVEVKSEDFCQFFDSKGANSRYETLQHSISMCLIRLFDRPQYPLVSLIQAFGQLVKDATNTWWETVPQDFKLAVHPPKPVS